MCLLSVGLDTLGFLLRIWLWISVPMAVLILLIATWMNYMRNARPKGGLTLAVEGLGGEMPGAGEMTGSGGMGGGGLGGGGSYIGRDEVVGEGSALEEGGPAEEEKGFVKEEKGFADGEEELTATGRETIYRGILWMKEKYEQYREQADRRYEQMREELGRSERRYEELMATMEASKNNILGTNVPGTVTDSRSAAAGMTAGEGEIMAEGGVVDAGAAVAGVAGAAQAGQGFEVRLAEAQGQLAVNQGIIDDLEGQLRVERTKVEELVVKLQANSQLLLSIYQELDKSFNF